jgi:hypothetical protein
VRAQLVVRNSSRNDVGPYRVTLPGYATGPTDGGEDSYRPFLIRAKPGDMLRIDLANQLDESDPDNIVNLHQHGLIVAPRPYSPGFSRGNKREGLSRRALHTNYLQNNEYYCFSFWHGPALPSCL